MFKKVLFAAAFVVASSPAFVSAQDVFIGFSDRAIDISATQTGTNAANPLFYADSVTATAPVLSGNTGMAAGGDTGTAFVFVRNGFDVSQLDNLEISSTNAAITSADLLQFNTLNVAPGANARWTTPATATTTATTATLFATNFGSLAADGNPPSTGIAGGALASFDDGFVASLDAFVLAQFDYTVDVGATSDANFDFTGGAVRDGNLAEITFDSPDAVFQGATLTVEAIPEPSSAIVLILGAAGMVARRRRS